jgi:hypothetical protein
VGAFAFFFLRLVAVGYCGVKPEIRAKPWDASLYDKLCIYMYLSMFFSVYVCIYVYIHIHAYIIRYKYVMCVYFYCTYIYMIYMCVCVCAPKDLSIL